MYHFHFLLSVLRFDYVSYHKSDLKPHKNTSQRISYLRHLQKLKLSLLTDIEITLLTSFCHGNHIYQQLLLPEHP